VKKKPIDPSETETINLLVEGIPVTVRVDEKGRPLT